MIKQPLSHSSRQRSSRRLNRGLSSTFEGGFGCRGVAVENTSTDACEMHRMSYLRLWRALNRA